MLKLILLLLPSQILAYGIGYSSYPLLPTAKLVGAEFTSVFSEGGGLGIQSRYTQKISQLAVLDIGVGMNGGERSGNFFLGVSYELFPDYGHQPKVAFKTTFESTREFDIRRSIFSIAPTVSKGFSFWGTEAYPFIALPIGFSLNTDDKTYRSQVSANFGLTGNLPFANHKQFIGTLEASLDLRNSFSGVSFGVSYALD